MANYPNLLIVPRGVAYELRFFGLARKPKLKNHYFKDYLHAFNDAISNLESNPNLETWKPRYPTPNTDAHKLFYLVEGKLIATMNLKKKVWTLLLVPTIGTSFDAHHGVDDLFILNVTEEKQRMRVATFDLTLDARIWPEKEKVLADVLIIEDRDLDDSAEKIYESLLNPKSVTYMSYEMKKKFGL